MPELPEVETIRRSLEPCLTGRQITGLQIRHPGILLPAPEAFAAILPGLRILALQRRGKYLILELSEDWCLVFHLRMTGKLLWTEDPQPPIPPHTHLIFQFENEAQLRFNDVRRFGRCWLVRREEMERISGLAALGPEPIRSDFTAEILKEKLRHKKNSKIKCALLDQTVVSGLGNIYVDEALFEAGIHPLRTAGSLSPEEIHALAEAARHVLQQSIRRGGTSLRNYVDGLDRQGENQYHLQVFRREGEPCPVCGTPIRRMKISGRSSFFCPRCQIAHPPC